jgi:hypothetical protein
MQRRNFLILGTLVGLSPYAVSKTVFLEDKTIKEVEQTIRAVQEHLFPEGSQIPSARSMYATQYLFDAIGHESYDKDIRAFVIEGAKELEIREKGRFVSLSRMEKERALRSYEETNYGSNWLGRIMTLTMEGMFGDPIYGSNVKESGWKALNAYGGQPRPKTRYIAL